MNFNCSDYDSISMSDQLAFKRLALPQADIDYFLTRGIDGVPLNSQELLELQTIDRFMNHAPIVFAWMTPGLLPFFVVQMIYILADSTIEEIPHAESCKVFIMRLTPQTDSGVKAYIPSVKGVASNNASEEAIQKIDVLTVRLSPDQMRVVARIMLDFFCLRHSHLREKWPNEFDNGALERLSHAAKLALDLYWGKFLS